MHGAVAAAVAAEVVDAAAEAAFTAVVVRGAEAARDLVVEVVFMAAVRVHRQDARPRCRDLRCPGHLVADRAAVMPAVDRAAIVLRWATCRRRAPDQARDPVVVESQIDRAVVQHVPVVVSRVLAAARRDPAVGNLLVADRVADSPVQLLAN
jgi:hypothetical protein